MKYKVGDRVKIKSLDWYNENKDDNREIKFENGIFTTLKSTFLGQIMTIEEITLEKQYILMEDKYKTLWTDEMFEGLVEDETTLDKVIEDAKTYWDSIKDAWICPEGYIFKDENGNVINATKIVLEKKKSKYPNTTKECCEVLNTEETYLGIGGHKGKLLQKFQKLLICRDAYWKIAGEEMGLGKPWEPDWGNPDHDSYPTITRCGGKIIRTTIYTHDCPFSFPTEEMRDAFKENFDPDIEICKEFL